MIKKIVYIFLLICLIAYYPFAPDNMDKDSMLILLVIAFFSVALFFFRKETNVNLSGQFLKHSTLAITGILIVHFQYDIDLLLGNTDKDDLFIWVNQNIVVKSLVLSVIGLVSFLLGFLFYDTNKIRESKITRLDIITVKPMLWIATVALTVFFITIDPLYLAGFYGEVDMGQQATYASLIFNLLIYAIIIQGCRNMVSGQKIPATFKRYIQQQGYHLLIVIAVYLAAVILSGDRGDVITLGICYVSGYFFVTKVKLKPSYAIVLFLAGAFIITVLGEVRQLDKNLEFTDRVVQSFEKNEINDESSFSPLTQELAASVRTLHIAVNYVPAHHDFLYGRFQFQQFFGVLPFFNDFLKDIFDDTSVKYNGSAALVTWIDQGDDPTSGDGTSCIADLYFDLGLFGVAAGMFFFGYLIRFCELTMYAAQMPSLFIHVLLIVYLSSAIYIARSTVLFDLKTVVWIFVILSINAYFLKRADRS